MRGFKSRDDRRPSLEGVAYHRVGAALGLSFIALWGFGCAPREVAGPGQASPANDRAAGKVTLPVRLSIGVDEGTVLALGEEAHFSLMITPEVDVAQTKVRFTQTGGVTFASGTEIELGPARPNEPVTASVRARLDEPGKVELRGWAEGYDSAGREVFAGSRALYLIVEPEKVLVGDNGFTALELGELARELESGEITPEEYEKRRRRIRTGGAIERIHIDVPDSSP